MDENNGAKIASGFHFFITFVFFIFLVVCSYFITKIFKSLPEDIEDNNAKIGKQLLFSAMIIAWIIITLILIGIIWILVLGVKGEFNKTFITRKLTNITGKKNIFVVLRIAVFSTLMVFSLIIGSLCGLSYSYFKKSNIKDVDLEILHEIAKALMLHTFLFIIIQFIIYFIYYAVAYKNMKYKVGESFI